LTHWISRVPETINEVKELLAIDQAAMQDLQENYRYLSLCSSYAGIQQRWLLIWSKEAYYREIKTLNKNYRNKSEAEYSNFKQLCKKEFACQADAQKAFEEFSKKCQYVVFDDFKINEISKYSSKGRPSETTVPERLFYTIEANTSCSIDHYKTKEQTKGKFILATDELNQSELSDLELFKGYKNQGKVERGFRFLKDPQFAAATFFVDKPERVEVLLMIMTLCLMVYAILEHQVRSRLAQTKTNLPDQLGKPTQKPTMRWVFQLLKGIHILYIDEDSTISLNVKEIHEKVISLLGTNYRKYYLLI